MDLKFKVNAKELNAAIGIASIVPPRSFNAANNAGYLFVVNGTTCNVYSRAQQQVSKSFFTVSEVEGEGAFIYPSQYIGAFQHVSGDITFSVHSEGDSHTVKYSFGKGAGAERSTFDTKFLLSCEKELAAATPGYSLSIQMLKEALSLAKSYLPKPADTNAEEKHKAVRIFDASQETTAKGNGTLYAANGRQAFYFQCDTLKDTGFAIHLQHLPFFLSFLSKAIGNQIKISSGTNMTFATDETGNVLGWSLHKDTPEKFWYYSLKNDKFVLHIDPTDVLHGLRYIQSELDKDKDKIKVTFDPSLSSLTFYATDSSSKATSAPITLSKVEVPENQEAISWNVGLEHFRSLFDGVRTSPAELRVAVTEPSPGRPKGAVMFRTIDEFWLDDNGKVVGGAGVPEDRKPAGATKCLVTRLAPGKD